MPDLGIGAGLKCSDCKRIVSKLVPFNDDGTGKKLCRECKRIKRKEDDLDGR